MKPEFTIEKIKEFNKKQYNSVAARYVKSAEIHIQQLQQENERLKEYRTKTQNDITDVFFGVKDINILKELVPFFKGAETDHTNYKKKYNDLKEKVDKAIHLYKTPEEDGFYLSMAELSEQLKAEEK